MVSRSKTNPLVCLVVSLFVCFFCFVFFFLFLVSWVVCFYAPHNEIDTPSLGDSSLLSLLLLFYFSVFLQLEPRRCSVVFLLPFPFLTFILFFFNSRKFPGRIMSGAIFRRTHTYQTIPRDEPTKEIERSSSNRCYKKKNIELPL